MIFKKNCVILLYALFSRAIDNNFCSYIAEKVNSGERLTIIISLEHLLRFSFNFFILLIDLLLYFVRATQKIVGVCLLPHLWLRSISNETISSTLSWRVIWLLWTSNTLLRMFESLLSVSDLPLQLDQEERVGSLKVQLVKTWKNYAWIIRFFLLLLKNTFYYDRFLF